MDTPHITTLAPELQHCIDQYHRDRTRVRELAAPLDNDRLNRRPSEKRWSVAECIDHLIVSGELGRQNINAAIETGRRHGTTGRPPFSYSFLSRWLIGMAGQYPPKLKVPTVGKFEPQKKRFTADDLVGRFDALQAELAESARSANGLHLAKIKVVSPISSLIRIPLGQYFRLIVGHQNRHILQAQDALEAVRT